MRLGWTKPEGCKDMGLISRYIGDLASIQIDRRQSTRDVLSIFVSQRWVRWTQIRRCGLFDTIRLPKFRLLIEQNLNRKRIVARFRINLSFLYLILS